MEATINPLQIRLAELKAAEPKLRNRQLAERLGVSEAELLTLGELGDKVIRLTGDWKQLLIDVKELGYVMALTRNEDCVHERKGIYDNLTFYDGPHNMGVAVNPDIDLRLFMNEWVYGLAVIMSRPNDKELYSLQFFNAKGEAVHKIFSTPRTDVVAYRELVERYRDEQVAIKIKDRSPKPLPEEKPDAEIDVAGFQQDWRDLKDTHHFFGMLRKYGLTRTQALRLAPEGMVTQVNELAVTDVLESAVKAKVSIMCFVHSPGCIQIHSGEVRRLMWHGSWFNVMDPAFNLHLDTKSIDSCYVVRKPTEDGQVTSLELFDAEGRMIVYFFGARKPGKPELTDWRKILETLAAQPQSQPA
ncbi:hemin-degrading factor [Lewinellaceae bacterium SD302]|nr:hemin-degrading factor [Lewinellaceae bacterium SD302]